MGKKRKKKIYTTPKKLKHKHVNIKLNIINVLTNRPKCSDCNNNMAKHFDRFTCTFCNKSKII